MDGQLWPAERQFLHDAVVSARPNIVLEVGTWKGGGSTWQIATALKELKHGHLHTCEINSDFYIEAKKIYDNDEWRPYVTCWNTPSKSLIDHMKTSGDTRFYILRWA